TESRAKALSFDVGDIRSGLPWLDAELTFSVGAKDFRYTRRQWRETFASDDQENIKRLRRQILGATRLRERARNLLRDLELSQGVSDSDVFVPSHAELKM